VLAATTLALLCTLCTLCATIRSAGLRGGAWRHRNLEGPAYARAQEPSDSPLLGLLYLPHLLSPSQCETIVAAAEQRTWQTARHASYPTTDIATSTAPHIERALLEADSLLREQACAAFGFRPGELWLRDQFVVKYSPRGQNRLSPHRDASPISYVLALNENYEGGGLAFADGAPPEAQPRKLHTGEGVVFCGKRLHEGLPVTAGTRYIVTGFLDAHPCAETVQKIAESNAEALRRVIGVHQWDVRPGMVPTRPYLRSNTRRLVGKDACEAGDMTRLSKPGVELLWPHADLRSVIAAARKVVERHGAPLGESLMHEKFHYYLTHPTECGTSYCHMAL
jgi:hypothetical protein